jgi:glycosyltransferase involved in cell wall biosynthesis
VIHAAAEIAGQPALLCRGLRALGVDARSVACESSWLEYPSDVEIDGRGAFGLVRRLGALLTHGRGLDILHLHFGTSFLPRLLDVPLFAASGTRLVFHFHGCEVRPRAHMLAHHPLSACSECPVYCVPARQQRLLEVARRHGALLLVSTPDLLEAVPDAEHLPVAIDLAEWDVLRAQAVPAPGFVVVHAPSEPNIKGTRHVVAAVEALAARHPDVRLELVEREPAMRARRRYGSATVAVDQLHLGWHGLFAVEAMALGKPVAVYIRPDLDRADLPVVRTDRERLADDLTRLRAHPEERSALGSAGVDYVRRVHDVRVVGARLLALYRRILGTAGELDHAPPALDLAAGAEGGR